jgi:CubicO group peptidase (beta-lactamase class C family)
MPAMERFIGHAVHEFFDKTKAVGMAVGVQTLDTTGQSREWVFLEGTTGRSGEKPTVDTLWQIGSVTKTFTAFNLASACVEERLRLDGEIQLHAPDGIVLPTFRDYANETSIRFVDLATHTAGLPQDPKHVPGIGGYMISSMYEYLDAYALAVAPGTHWNYSNLGYGLLADLLVRAAGANDYQSLIAALLEKYELRMPDTSVDVGETPRRRYAVGFAQPGRVATRSSATWPAFNGSGALCSTLNDLLMWTQFNAGVLTRRGDAERELVLSPHFDDGNVVMGLAWQLGVCREADVRYWYKGGTTNGFTSFVAFEPGLRSGVVIVTNSAWAWPADLANLIIAIAHSRSS